MQTAEPDAGEGARLRWSFAALAAAGVAAAPFLPATPSRLGGTTLERWWAVQIAAAFAVLALGAGTRWARASRWGALLFVGLAGQLDLLEPLWLHFLEMRPGELRAGTHPLALAALTLQTALVLGAGLRVRTDLRRFAAALPRGVPLAALALLLWLMAAHVSPFATRLREPRFAAAYAAQVAAAVFTGAVFLLHLVLLVRAAPRESLSRVLAAVRTRLTLSSGPGPVRPWDRRLPWVAAAFALVAAAAVNVLVFERTPHIPDSVAYLVHAKTLAAGRLTLPAPPEPEAFAAYLVPVEDGRWFVTTSPGWPAVLALGVLAGAPWLVNPLLGALGVLLVHRLFRSLGGLGAAHLAAGLAATSPWLLFLSASFMNHALVLALVAGAWALLARERGRPAAVPAALGAGLLLGYLTTVRPLDGVVAGLLTGAWLLRRAGWLRATAYAAGCVTGGGWLLLYHRAMTGRALLDPLTRYYDRIWYPGANRLGFGSDVGNPPGGWGTLDPFPGHGPLDVLLNLNQNLCNLNLELHGWAAGSLLLGGLHLFRGPKRPADRALAGFGVAAVAAYSLYWFSGGPDFGPRYWSLLLLPALWWTVRGLGTARALGGRLVRRSAAPALALGVAAMVASSLLVFDSWRCAARYADYRGFHGDYLARLEAGEFGRALVLVHAEHVNDYHSAYVLNEPGFPPDAPVFARFLGPESADRLVAAFPGRPVIHLLGRTAAAPPPLAGP